MNTSSANLTINADLECILDENPVSICTIGNRIIVEVPNLASMRKLLQLGSSWGSYRQRAWQLKRVLDHCEHSLDVKVKDLTILRVGFGEGDRRWAVLGLPKMRIKIVVLLLILFGR